MRNALVLLVVLVALPAVAGCGLLDVFVEKTFSIFTPPPKTTPKFSLSGRSVLILVDAASHDLSAARPRMKFLVADALARELSERRAARTITNPRDVVFFAQSRPDFDRLSVVEIGRAFDVQCVLHVIVYDYRLERTAAGGDSYGAYANVGLRVIDLKAAEQVFPALGGDHLVEVRSPTVIMADSTEAAERVLLDGLAMKVGQVFVAYNIEELPRKREVK